MSNGIFYAMASSTYGCFLFTFLGDVINTLKTQILQILDRMRWWRQNPLIENLCIPCTGRDGWVRAWFIQIRQFLFRMNTEYWTQVGHRWFLVQWHHWWCSDDVLVIFWSNVWLLLGGELWCYCAPIPSPWKGSLHRRRNGEQNHQHLLCN